MTAQLSRLSGLQVSLLSAAQRLPLPVAAPAAEEEAGSAVEWALLQTLLSRGLRQVAGSTFRQLPVLLTHVGDELLQASSAAGAPCASSPLALHAGLPLASANTGCAWRWAVEAASIASCIWLS